MQNHKDVRNVFLDSALLEHKAGRNRGGSGYEDKGEDTWGPSK